MTDEPRSQSHERLQPRRLNDYFAYDGYIVCDYFGYVGYFLYIVTPQRVQVSGSYDDDYTCVLLSGFLLNSGQLSTPAQQLQLKSARGPGRDGTMKGKASFSYSLLSLGGTSL
ncbi:uncharacterized protein LOC112271827 isoform X2 [Brachypodium distachyon]|uniref:uncharacterized protein LOC112271827 isoform X2 n=1 Tax=Brachypodium distachyon TaxID=15368 RepID=UPI000D0D38C5|nr:uncharacterized protein LOC112271827 isoform X2 [Brachypodium distachyon]|eukprot:XP_024317777.1 uncharacterized protein LOC112271827 isoform X2 [Brachypodium distachyon]